MSAKEHRCTIQEKWSKLPVRANMLHTHDSSSSSSSSSRQHGFIQEIVATYPVASILQNSYGKSSILFQESK
jgi:hypothetical protein